MNEFRFNPEHFADNETGELYDANEFLNQVDLAIESGQADRALEYLSDRLPNATEREVDLLQTALVDVVVQLGNPDATLFHASQLAERYEEKERYVQAAQCCGVVMDVLVEKNRWQDAALWLERTRRNLHQFNVGEEKKDVAEELYGASIRETLGLESNFFLAMAAGGKSKQALKQIERLVADPVVPAEAHVLWSTVAFIHGDLRNHLQVGIALRKAESLAVQNGDYIEAATYACRRSAPTMATFGAGAARSLIDQADEYLETAEAVGSDDKRITEAEDIVEQYRQAFRGMS